MRYALVCMYAIGLLLCRQATETALGQTKEPTSKPVVTWEDLSSCKLPNGITDIPAEGSGSAAKNGCILAFATGKLTPMPKLPQESVTPKVFVETIQAAKAGDLLYSDGDGGLLCAMSGSIADLGKSYLSEHDDEALPAPAKVTGLVDRREFPGVVNAISIGKCYLVATADGKYAIFRVIMQGDRSVTIQWVFQPDGSRKFVIPRGQAISPGKPLAGAHSEPAKPPEGDTLLKVPELNMADWTAAVSVHEANQARLVRLGITLLRAKDTPEARRVAVCDFFGKFRVVKAAPTLAEMIGLGDSPGTWGSNVPTIPCVTALIAIGLPGAEAAVKQIVADALKGEELRFTRERRCARLTHVIAKVYGEKYAKSVIEEQLAQATTPEVKSAFEYALKSLAVLEERWTDEVNKTQKPRTKPSSATLPAK